MRLGRTLIVVCFLLGIGMMLSPASVRAQRLHLDLQEVEMVRALDLFSKQTGVSVVYADRIIRARNSTCSYDGPSKQMALSCVIGDGLQAAWLRRDQVVLTERPVATKSPTLTGTVLDAETGNALPGANVALPDFKKGTVADQGGHFAIVEAPAAPFRLQVSYLGYEPMELTVRKPEDRQVVEMTSLMLEGEAVVVEGQRSSDSDELGGMARSVSSWSQEYGDGLDQSDMLQTAAIIPGIGRTGEISGGLVVRGGLPDQSVFLLDGAPVYQPWHSQGLFSILQSSATDDVLLYSGPLPADKGGQLAAVLDASLSAGSLQGAVTTASMTSSLGEVSVKTPLARGLTGMFAARRSHQGLSRTHSQSLPNSQPLDGGSFYDMAAKIGFQSSPANLFSFTMYRGGDRFSGESESSGDAESQGVGSFQNEVYALQHRYAPNDRVLITNSIYASIFDAKSGVSAEEVFGLGSGDEYQEIRDTGLRIDIDYFASTRHALKFGVHVAQHHVEWSEESRSLANANGPPLLTTFRDEVVDGALYVQDTWNITDRMTLRPGLRVSWFGNQIGKRFEPRFHSKYQLTRDSNLRFAWSHQVQYLHQVHNIVNGGLGSTITKWIVPSGPTIAPSNGDQVVFGFVSRRNEYWTVSADVYWRHLKHVFLPSEPELPMLSIQRPLYHAPPERFEDFEQGNAKSYGLELQASYKRDWFRFRTSYTGSRSLIQLASDPSSTGYRSGVYDTPHVVRVATGFEGSRWAFSLASEARTGYPTLTTVQAPRQEGDSRLPTYFRLDAALGYRFTTMGARWDLQGRIYNLTDRENIVGYEYDDNILNLRRTSLLGVTRWPTFRVAASW